MICSAVHLRQAAAACRRSSRGRPRTAPHGLRRARSPSPSRLHKSCLLRAGPCGDDRHNERSRATPAEASLAGPLSTTASDQVTETDTQWVAAAAPNRHRPQTSKRHRPLFSTPDRVVA